MKFSETKRGDQFYCRDNVKYMKLYDEGFYPNYNKKGKNFRGMTGNALVLSPKEFSGDYEHIELDEEVYLLEEGEY